MMEVKLLEKTELFFHNIVLKHVNLDQVAGAVAGALGLNHRDVAVIDVQPGILTVDILRSTVTLENILGKEKALLSALADIAGVTVTEEAVIHSEGVLGLVNLDENHVAALPARVEAISGQITSAIRLRAMVFPTGNEIIEGNIEDTNTSFLVSLLTSLGYRVTPGKPLADSLEEITGALHLAADMGYGLVITTGGVGAEDKDYSVEAVMNLDPGAVAPYIVHYTKGQGRHKKDGVRIAVGSLELTTYVALPGPHDEVQLVTPVLVQGLCEQWDKSRLAEELVKPLRAKLVPS